MCLAAIVVCVGLTRHRRHRWDAGAESAVRRIAPAHAHSTDARRGVQPAQTHHAGPTRPAHRSSCRSTRENRGPLAVTRLAFGDRLCAHPCAPVDRSPSITEKSIRAAVLERQLQTRVVAAAERRGRYARERGRIIGPRHGRLASPHSRQAPRLIRGVARLTPQRRPAQQRSRGHRWSAGVEVARASLAARDVRALPDTHFLLPRPARRQKPTPRSKTAVIRRTPCAEHAHHQQNR